MLGPIFMSEVRGAPSYKIVELFRTATQLDKNDKQTNVQTDRQTDRIYRQTDRQTSIAHC